MNSTCGAAEWNRRVDRSLILTRSCSLEAAGSLALAVAATMRGCIGQLQEAREEVRPEIAREPLDIPNGGVHRQTARAQAQIWGPAAWAPGFCQEADSEVCRLAGGSRPRASTTQSIELQPCRAALVRSVLEARRRAGPLGSRHRQRLIAGLEGRHLAARHRPPRKGRWRDCQTPGLGARARAPGTDFGRVFPPPGFLSHPLQSSSRRRRWWAHANARLHKALGNRVRLRADDADAHKRANVNVSWKPHSRS